MDIQDKKCITPEAGVSYPAVFEPKSFQGQAAKYSVVLRFKDSQDISALKRAAKNALIEKWGADNSKWPKGLKLPFRKGEERDAAGFGPGIVFISASSKTQPGLVNAKLERIINPADFYPGCYARAELIAFAYDTAGNKGVSFSLQNLQKTRDGKNLSGRKAAEDVFDAVDDGSDDLDNYDFDGDDDSSGDAFDDI